MASSEVPEDKIIYVLGIDPGGTTGWAVIGVPAASIYGNAQSRIAFYDFGDVTGNYTDQVLEICSIAANYTTARGTLALAVESFSPRKPITSPEFFSPMLVGARIQFCVDVCRIIAPIFYQTPELAMSTAPDNRLKAWGLYEPGPNHIKDATRHAITFIRRCSQSEPNQKKANQLRLSAWGSPSTHGLKSVRTAITSTPVISRY